jgi:amino acid transporter
MRAQQGRRPVAAPRGLDRRALGANSLFFFGVGASAPLTAVVGGIVAALAGTQIASVAAAFVVLTVALFLFSVGYASMARHLPHAGPLYAHIARGLGPVRGVGAAAVLILCYNAIQICLYGLLGATLADAVGGPWWAWAVAAWAVIAVLGVAHVRLNAQVLAGLLVLEIVVVVAFNLAAFAHPADGSVDLTPLLPTHLFSDGVGSVIALSAACFIGYETSLAFVEEARTPQAAARATLGSLLFLGCLFTVSALAVVTATGASGVGLASVDLIFGVLRDAYGPLVSLLANVLLVTSIVAAGLSFHQTVARYVFVLGRERLLSAKLGYVRDGSGVPVGGSVAQSAVAIAVLLGWALFRLDPMVLFTAGAAVAALGLMAVMAVACVAVLRFYRKGGGGNEGAWTRVVAPSLGAVAMGALVAVVVSNLHSLIGVDTGSLAVWIVPGLIAAVALAGLLAGFVVRARQPAITAGLGLGETEPLAELEHHLVGVDI